jgi:hypothetical protein
MRSGNPGMQRSIWSGHTDLRFILIHDPLYICPIALILHHLSRLTVSYIFLIASPHLLLL